MRSIVTCSPLRISRPAAVWPAPKPQPLLFGARGIQTPAASRVIIRAQALAVAVAQQAAAADGGFSALGLTPGLQEALLEAQITQPTEIQVRTGPQRRCLMTIGTSMLRGADIPDSQ